MIPAAKLIEQFVGTLNNDGVLEPLFGDEVPLELRRKELAEIDGLYEWKICATPPNSWVPALEDKLPFPFPQLYHHLITNYRFAEFEVGPIMFLANTGSAVFHELSEVVFRDKGMYPTLLENGLLQFGQQAGGGYDPICFDMAHRFRDDAPIVQVDHEDVLMRERIRSEKIAPTFQKFIEEVIAAGPSAC